MPLKGFFKGDYKKGSVIKGSGSWLLEQVVCLGL